MTTDHAEVFWSYIGDVRAALLEHGVDRMEDLPRPVYDAFLERAVSAGYLSDDPDEWGDE